MEGLYRVIALPILIVISGCIHDSDATQNSNVAYTIESSGTLSGIQNQQFHVINGDNQYSDFLSGVTLTGDIPVVDFTNYLLAVVVPGNHRGCLGDAVSVSSVNESENTVSIASKRTIGDPPPGMACVASLPAGAPYVMVKIPRTSKLISLNIE